MGSGWRFHNSRTGIFVTETPDPTWHGRHRTGSMREHKADLRAEAEARNAEYQAARAPVKQSAPVLTPEPVPDPTEEAPATRPPRQRTHSRDTETRKRRPYRQSPGPEGER